MTHVAQAVEQHRMSAPGKRGTRAAESVLVVADGALVHVQRSRARAVEDRCAVFCIRARAVEYSSSIKPGRVESVDKYASLS